MVRCLLVTGNCFFDVIFLYLVEPSPVIGRVFLDGLSLRSTALLSCFFTLSERFMHLVFRVGSCNVIPFLWSHSIVSAAATRILVQHTAILTPIGMHGTISYYSFNSKSAESDVVHINLRVENMGTMTSHRTPMSSLK